MTEDDYEDEFVDEEDELFKDETETIDLDEDDDFSPEEEGFLKGYKEASKRKKQEEEF